MKKTKSAKGEIVDFNLLQIKQQIAAAPVTTDVQARQDFIDKRLHRKLKTISPPAAPIINDSKKTTLNTKTTKQKAKPKNVNEKPKNETETTE